MWFKNTSHNDGNYIPKKSKVMTRFAWDIQIRNHQPIQLSELSKGKKLRNIL